MARILLARKSVLQHVFRHTRFLTYKECRRGGSKEELLSAPSGISGLKMLASLPGFNVQTDGALGLYEFGNSVQVRAFNLGQIGFVLNGIPMGRSDPFGGSPIFRYVDNENLGSVVASPGAGDVSGPSYSTLGPITFYGF